MGRAATKARVDDSEERILRAALETFAEKGFDGSKTRDIATRAGVNLGLVQYYFGTKLKLWQAAVDLTFEELRGGLDAVLEDHSITSDRERLRNLIRGHVYFVARKPEFVRFMHDEGKRKGPRSRWLVDRHVKPMYERILPIIEKSQRIGIVPANVPSINLMYIFIGSVAVFFHQAEECKRVSGINPMDDACVEAHANAVERIFLGHSSSEN